MNVQIQPIKLILKNSYILDFNPISGMDPNFVIYTPTFFKEIKDGELIDYYLVIPPTSANNKNLQIKLNFSRDDCTQVDNIFNIYYLVSKIGIVKQGLDAEGTKALRKYQIEYNTKMIGGERRYCVFSAIVNQFSNNYPQIRDLIDNPFFYLTFDGSFYYFVRFEYSTSYLIFSKIKVKSIVRISKPIYEYIYNWLSNIQMFYIGLKGLLPTFQSGLNIVKNRKINYESQQQQPQQPNLSLVLDNS